MAPSRTLSEQAVESGREGRGNEMDFATSGAVGSDDVTDTEHQAHQQDDRHPRVQRRHRRQPRRAADRIRQGHAAATAICCPANPTRICSPASPRPMPTTQDHAQRVYDYISKLWFMPATPVLSNGGTGRGLPISCYLNTRQRQPRRHRRHLERECLAGVEGRRHRHLLGQRCAASASRSASTARPAASSRSSA